MLCRYFEQNEQRNKELLPSLDMISIPDISLPSFATLSSLPPSQTSSSPTPISSSPSSNLSPSKESDLSSVYDLNDDCLGCIGQYLTPQELCNLCQTCHFFHALPTFRHLWRLHCYQKWNWNKNQKNMLCKLTRKFDGFALFPFTSPISDQILTPLTKRFQVSDLMVEYVGPVGRGNRSVRSNQPFPFIKSDSENSIFNSMTNYFPSHSPLSTLPSFSRYRSRSTFSSSPSPSSSCRFFSTPYYNSLLQDYQIELRQVAYYEITIKSASSPSVTSSSSSPSLSEEDCVAVGLSTDSFYLLNLMPGWNSQSYGYHSDDGAIFHGRGIQKAVYGPKFGIDDVVGCGLRYDRNEIFFTLNGRYLGVAFGNVNGQFYPTVGIDANVQIKFNFGLSPFSFPLHELPKYSN
jgi:hypothetical protein